MRGLFLLPTVYRLNASELAATKVETSLQFRTIIRSTPTEMQSMSENDFECFASTDVNTPGTMFPFGLANIRFPRSRLLARNGFELAAQSESASRSAVNNRALWAREKPGTGAGTEARDDRSNWKTTPGR